MFDYELSFTLFNGNGSFRILCDKIEITLQNATSGKDLEIVQDCVAKIYEHVPLPEIGSTLVSANAHSVFSTSEELNKFLSQYSNPAKQILAGGVISYVRCSNWQEDVRMTIDKSLVYPTGLFLTWSTTCRGTRISRETIGLIEKVFEEAVTKYDLSFDKNS